MIRLTNPEAETALWKNHESWVYSITKMYSELKLQVLSALSESISKVHVSFDHWTSKEDNCSFLGVVAHYANASGEIVGLPIPIPQPVGIHAGERIADVVSRNLQYFGINRSKLGCFVLGNTYNEGATANKLATMCNFDAAERWLRCSCNVLNLIGQTIMFGKDSQAYTNTSGDIMDEDLNMKEWQKDGAFRLFSDVISYINTPKQYELFKSCQRQTLHKLGYTDTAVDSSCQELVKPVATCWVSFYHALKRGVELRQAVTSYTQYHIQDTKIGDSRAALEHKDVSEVPNWMRNEGFTAADWAVITAYVAILQLLKHATDRLQTRGEVGNFGALYEAITVFDHIINELETCLRLYESVSRESSEAREDSFPINLRDGCKKAMSYFDELSRAPVYYTSTILHPHYKHYFGRSWRFRKAALLRTSHNKFLQLWATYRPDELVTTVAAPSMALKSNFDDAIDSMLDNGESTGLQQSDEYTNWLQEPTWTAEEHKNGQSVVTYWQNLRPKYPNHSRLALDCMTIPASAADYKRVFSRTGNTHESRRPNTSAELQAALVCIQQWIRAGFNSPNATKVSLCSD